MPIYDFQFPEAAAGAVVRVRDAAGAIVNTGFVSVASGGSAYYSVALGSGDYDASVQPAVNVPDVAGAESNGVGAAETAYFVATGPTFAADGGWTNPTLIADDRHGALPDWVSIVAGEAVLTSDAGTCACNATGTAELNFDTTAPSASGDLWNSVRVKVNGVGVDATIVSNSVGEPGDGQDIQTPTALSTGSLIFAGQTVSVEIGPYGDEGGTLGATGTPSVAFTITRIAQAAVLPE